VEHRVLLPVPFEAVGLQPAEQLPLTAEERVERAGQEVFAKAAGASQELQGKKE